MLTANQLGLVRQYFAAITACISSAIMGMFLGWPSPILPPIKAEGQPFRMTNEEISWMVSIIYLGNVISPLPTGYLMDKFGRKMCFMVLTVLPLSSWCFTRFATNSELLYAGRFLAGAWSGVVTTVTPLYLAEISEPRIRGSLSTFLQLSANIGLLAEYLIGSWVNYNTLTYISAAFPVLFVILFYYMPESPYWLLTKNQKEKAARSLSWLRGEGNIETDIRKMTARVEEEMKLKTTFKDLVATKGTRQALLIVETLSILQRMSGVSALLAYTSITLPLKGTGRLTPNGCVIVLGFIWVFSVFIAMGLMDSLGRKPLLIASSLGCGLAMSMAGIWFFLDQTNYVDVTPFSYIPFIAFMIYGLFFGIGLGPIPTTIQGEAFPSNIKGLASGITSFIMAVTSFTMNKMYHPLTNYVGLWCNYLIYSIACFSCLVYCIFFMIETKHKTLGEIYEELNTPKTRNEAKTKTAAK